MARRRKMTPERREFINGLLEHYQPTDAQDVQEMLKDLLGDTLQGMLEAEMDQKLGYSKYDYQNKKTDDSRNDYSHKTVINILFFLVDYNQKPNGMVVIIIIEPIE